MEYLFNRKIPTGWETLAGPRDTRSFWDGVKADVEANAVDATDLVAVAAVRDRHLQFEALMFSLPTSDIKPTFTNTDGAATASHTLKMTYAVGSTEDTLLNAVLTNGSEVHLLGSHYKATVTAVAAVNAGADNEFDITITEA